jgi:hypothetical protein
MKKLSSITRNKNCFITVDNHILKNIRDLLDYLSICSEANFVYHVNEQKNEFANWTEQVLLFPELANTLRNIRTVSGTRDAILAFFKEFDFESKNIPDDKMFFTVDGYTLKNIQELYYYLNNCDDASFKFHLNEQKNDFAKWMDEVLAFPELATRMRSVYEKEELIAILKGFFIRKKSNTANSDITPVADQEYKKYLDERKVDVNEKKVIGDRGIIANHEPKDEEKINLDMKLKLKNDDEDDEVKESSFGMEGFKQFSDEDLEKFTKFVKGDDENLIETDAKVEYLRAALQELKNIIGELRRAEKDPLIADLMLRTLNAKIDYYALSKNSNEYALIIKQMKEAQREMEECAVQQTYNIAEEILKDLKLQGLAMKKAYQ